MQQPRPIPLGIAFLAAVAVIASCAVMARRIVAYNTEQGRTTYMQFEVTDREFSFAERPVTITDIPVDQTHPLGAVRIDYADQPLTLPVTIPSLEYSDQFPGMERHNDWLRVVRFAELTGRTYDQLVEAMDRREEPDRLVVVAKSPRPGVNTDTWGRVWRKDWVFDFYEFLPDGTLAHERLAYPTVRTAAQQDDRRAAEARGDGGLPELDTRSWQFQIATLLMPEGSAPRIIAGDSPLVAAGWTLPTAAVCTLAAVGGLLLAFAPSRVLAAGRDADAEAPDSG